MLQMNPIYSEMIVKSVQHDYFQEAEKHRQRRQCYHALNYTQIVIRVGGVVAFIAVTILAVTAL